MHDIKIIRENPAVFDAALARRGIDPVALKIVALDETRRGFATELQQGQARRNEASKAIGKAKGQGDGETAQALMSEVSELKKTLPELEQKERDVSTKLQAILAALPNLPDDDVPTGTDEDDNIEVERWGKPRDFDFEPKEHSDIGPALGLDFDTGTKMSGARFTFLRGQMARLQRAIGQFMLDRQTGANGYAECAPPLLVKDRAMYGTGQLPKFTHDQFFAADMNNRDRLLWNAMPDDFEKHMAEAGAGSFKEVLEEMLENADTAEQFWLIPTAEVSLTNSVREEILEEAQLPIRLTALTPCFRSEAGAAGKDTKGYIRQHQFEKVELVTIAHPDHSETEHERMAKAAESILQALELPYRKMLLCAGDMGAAARKTFDLEVWLPGQDAYREISSISNTGEYQARRMNTRFRPDGDDKGTRFVHTLNGSGLAVGRTLVAVLENYQQEDGSVDIPEVLKPYMGGVAKLEKP